MAFSIEDNLIVEKKKTETKQKKIVENCVINFTFVNQTETSLEKRKSFLFKRIETKEKLMEKFNDFSVGKINFPVIFYCQMRNCPPSRVLRPKNAIFPIFVENLGRFLFMLAVK